MEMQGMFDGRESPVPGAVPIAGYASLFFLRTVAKNRRNSPNAVEWLPYCNALVATAFVFVAAPVGSLLSTIVIIGIRYFPHFVIRSFGLAPRFFTVAIPLAALLGGYFWFRYRFRGYPYNTKASGAFDSERDRDI